jgi:DNA-directed RNA polymerase III subunit RPC1
VNRAVITHSEADTSKLELAIEGQGLCDVLATHGINWRKTTSNNILEVRNVLGIEAARYKINCLFTFNHCV